MLRLTILAVSLMAICAMSIDEEFDFPEVITFEYGKRVAGEKETLQQTLKTFAEYSI